MTPDNDRRTTVSFLLILLGIGLITTYGILRPFLRPAAFALVLGIGFAPLHTQSSKLIPKKTLAALSSTLVILLIFVVPSVLLASAASKDLIHAAQHVNQKSASGGGILAYVAHWVDIATDRLGKYVDLDKSGLRDLLDSLPARISQALFTAGTALVKGLATFTGEALITFFVLFFVFRDGGAIADQLTALLPLNAEHSNRLFSRIREGIVANLYGILAVSVIQGVLTGFAFLIVGVPSPLLWGVSAAILSLVPIVGSSLVWLPTAIVLIVEGHWGKGIFLIGWEAILVGLADNVVRPIVLAGRVQLHPLLLLFAVVGGVRQFGFIGLFVGPVVISVIFALIEMLREEAHSQAEEIAGA
jgi:predicted PurR-regulated permease PerM